MAKIKEVDMKMDVVKQFIEDSSERSAVYVGCDSKVATKRGKRVAVYVVVIVVHKDQNCGAKLFKQVRVLPDYGNMRQRLMQEVYMAAEIGLELVDVVGERPFEIHLDLNPNPNEKSSVVIKEAMGYIMGVLGVEANVKPNSIASSCAADRWAVKLAG